MSLPSVNGKMALSPTSKQNAMHALLSYTMSYTWTEEEKDKLYL